MDGPKPDQIEICTFGPGFGECSIIHLGNDNWIVVDSCLDSETKNPVAIDYLASIKVDPSRVRLVVATHWHDDHVRGMAKQLAVFSSAKFCASSALTAKEFRATVIAYEERHNISVGSGASEISEVLNILKERVGVSSPVRASPNRPILLLEASETAHGLPVTVRTLSPSDKQFDLFLTQLTKLFPAELKTRTRIPDDEPNHISIALHIEVGDQAILLGADLEENGDPELGWSAIVNSSERPRVASRIFKIPHHGSKNGHCGSVWNEMLSQNPIAVLTPWNRGSKLPTDGDISRILNQTSEAFCTSRKKFLDKRERSQAVLKQIRETVGRLRPLQEKTGWVRIRNGGSANPTVWTVEMSPEACSLKDWAA